MNLISAFRSSDPKPTTLTLAGKEFPRVSWWRDAGLRKLYFYMLIPLMTSMVNGYDGSMMNALQTSTQWQSYFNHPTGGTLAFFNLSFGLGQLVAVLSSIPVLIADKLGRRWGIVIGSIVAIIGVAVQTSSQNCTW
jgi:hypothetical protein